jgi:MFS family permease
MPQRAPKSTAAVALPMICLHLLIATPLAYVLNIWSDEGSTLHTTQFGFLRALQNAATDERQAPLYFWIMSLWRTINGSIFFARVFSIICCVSAIWLFARLVRRFLDQRPALLATAFFSLHPILIWASAEIRVYSLVILMSVGILNVFLDAFFLENGEVRSRRNVRIVFLVLAIIGLYTNYYLGFLLAGCFAALLTARKWRTSRDYFLLMSLAGLAFLPQILTVRSQFIVNTATFKEDSSIIDNLRRLWSHMLTFILPADIVRQTETPPASIVRLWMVRAGVVIAGIFAFLRRDRLSGLTLGFGAVAATIILGLLAAYFLVGSWLVALRHASVLFAPLIIFLTSFINDIFGQKDDKRSLIGRLAVPATSLLVLAFFCYAVVTHYPHLAKPGDWARVGAYIERNEAPDQPIIIFHTYDAMSLPYHYHGVNRIFPDERFLDFDFGNSFDDPDHGKTRTDFTISKIPKDAGEIWLVVNDECRTAGKCEYLENYVETNYNVVTEKEFYLQKVSLLRKKSHDNTQVR